MTHVCVTHLSELDHIICSLGCSTHAMFLKPPADNNLNVFLHGSSAADQHHFGFYLIPQGPGAIKTIPIILNVSDPVGNLLPLILILTQQTS